MLRNPFAALRQAALLLALGAKGPGIDPRTVTASRPFDSQGKGQVRVASNTKAGRRMNSRVYRYRPNVWWDPRKIGQGQALRNRMGGNANRIVMARRGLLFWESQNNGNTSMSHWKESPTVLPEEVEERAKVYRELTPSDHPGSYYITEIRGHRVQLWPYMLGPVRYKVLKGTERFYDHYYSKEAYSNG